MTKNKEKINEMGIGIFWVGYYIMVFSGCFAIFAALLMILLMNFDIVIDITWFLQLCFIVCTVGGVMIPTGVLIIQFNNISSPNGDLQ